MAVDRQTNEMRTIKNPPSPFDTPHVEWLGPPPPARLVHYEEDARSILSENDSPDLPFRWSVNPYRGCQHACAYCYARPTHEYLGFGAGTDFETRIVVKRNAPELLAAAFRSRRWKRDFVAFSGVTDCYQALEAVHELTRRCLEVCDRFRNPVAIVTKSALVRRDLDLLQRLHERAGVIVHISLPFADPGMARRIEPGVPSPRHRLETMAALADAGIEVGVLVAPVVPGLNDQDLPEILERSRDHGARSAGFAALRLPGSVREVFLERLDQVEPGRAGRVRARIQEMRQGEWNDSRFGHRMRGQGPYWRSVEQLFEIHCRRLGLDRAERRRPILRSPTVRPTPRQGQLFGSSEAPQSLE